MANLVFALVVSVLFQLYFVAAAPEPSCIENSNIQFPNSARSDTLAAGAQLLAYFNDPTREGRLSLPAQSAGSTYEVAREYGKRGIKTEFTTSLTKLKGHPALLYSYGTQPNRLRPSPYHSKKLSVPLLLYLPPVAMVPFLLARRVSGVSGSSRLASTKRRRVAESSKQKYREEIISPTYTASGRSKSLHIMFLATGGSFPA